MPLVIGIDGGGTKTLLAAATADGDVVGILRGAGCNPFDQPDWQDVIASLRHRAGAWVADAAATGFGMPGFGEVEAVTERQKRVAATFVPATVCVLNDVETAFDGAFAGGDGVLLLAGTGSMVWSAWAGRTVRVGGWGDAFGDEGSAYWIGREAVIRASQAIDGRLDGAEPFARALFANLGLSLADPHDALIGWYRARRHLRVELAALARFVDREAAAGDRAADRILDDAADHLSRHVAAAWRALGGSGPVVWSVAGGAFASAILRARVCERVGTPMREPVLPPVGGALRRAALAAGWTADARWVSRLGASLAAFGDADSFNPKQEVFDAEFLG